MTEKWTITHNSQSQTIKVVECEGNTVELDKQDREILSGLFEMCPEGGAITLEEKTFKSLRDD